MLVQHALPAAGAGAALSRRKPSLRLPTRRPPPSLAARCSPCQIPAADVVGATSSGSELVIWHSPLHKPGADKPTRHLHRTPALQLESPSLAEQAAQHLRSAACWWHGGQHPPRLLVIVNPASGPGKCVAPPGLCAQGAFVAAAAAAAAHPLAELLGSNKGPGMPLQGPVHL